jgi:hypothetical protein
MYLHDGREMKVKTRDRVGRGGKRKNRVGYVRVKGKPETGQGKTGCIGIDFRWDF